VKLLRESREAVKESEYRKEWEEAIAAYLSCVFDRMLDFIEVQESCFYYAAACGSRAD
jgi:hypothetical protein